MNQKIDELLELGLLADDEELEKSLELGVGFDSDNKLWEVIVKYAGEIDMLAEKYKGIKINKLMNGYAVIVIRAGWIEMLAEEDNILYIEKPKKLFNEMINSKIQSCISSDKFARKNIMDLSGNGVIVAIIDSGIDIFDNEFRNKDGTTRILNIFDQNKNKEYSKDEIDEWLLTNQNRENAPGFDLIGHGTDVAKIACGNGGVAFNAEILIVKMGFSIENSFPRTAQLMEAVDYVIKKAIDYKKCIAVNISYGNNYGNHNGNSLVENFLEDISLTWKNVICVGSGNEGIGATHTGGYVKSYEKKTIGLVISSYETAINIQIWKNYCDDIRVEIITPSGKVIGIINEINSVLRTTSDGNKIIANYGKPSPFSKNQEIYIDIMAEKEYLTSGEWWIRLVTDNIIYGRYDMWLPGIMSLNYGSGFSEPEAQLTQTIPSTAKRIITVGAYDAISGATAGFSGRGNMKSEDIKPDIVAPGVDVMVDEFHTCTGTSFATPFVTGSAAILMEWGIVQKNDLYLYGEKLKAYLIKGAKQLPAMVTPNTMTGWGTVCVRDSLSV